MTMTCASFDTSGRLVVEADHDEEDRPQRADRRRDGAGGQERECRDAS